jgi:hypothetical protein
MRIAISILALLTASQASQAQVSFEDATRPVVRLEGDGPRAVTVNCPWERALIIRPSKEAPAAVLRCDEGGPGVTVDLKPRQ